MALRRHYLNSGLRNVITLVTGALTAYGDLAQVAVMLGCALLGGLICLLFSPASWRRLQAINQLAHRW